MSLTTLHDHHRNAPRIISGRIAQIAAASSPFRTGYLAAKALCDTGAVKGWLSFLDTFERTYGLAPAPAELIVKPLSNYAVYGLTISERAAILRAHYDLVALKLPRTLLSQIWSGRSREIGVLHGKKQQSYRLSLDPAGHCYKEGELGLTLSDAADGLELARLTFVLQRESCGTKHMLLIGGLQGPSSHCGPGAKARIIAATRALYGLRPKMIVFTAATAFARATGAQGLRAVSNRTHTINADAWYQRRRMHADYDAFWIERGGAPDRFGFNLPLWSMARTQVARRHAIRSQICSLVYGLFNPENASGHVSKVSELAS